ncbi:MAG: hypothetical protein NC350_05790 [Corallococcus sp.]|nr:hypothetical protein [Corallococcus sp.]
MGFDSRGLAEELRPDNILPYAYDKRAHKMVAEKVKQAAISARGVLLSR